MRRIILILVIVGALVGVGAGAWWWFHRNSGEMLLARAELAIRAKNFDRAIELSKQYAAANPDDWKGPFVQAEANMALGQYEEARDRLDAAAKVAPDEVRIPMARADTYAHPARRSLASNDPNLPADVMEEAIGQFEEAKKVLEKAPTSGEKAALDVSEALGLIQMDISYARKRLGNRLKKQAEVFKAAGAAEQATAKEKEAEDAFAKADGNLKEAVKVLLSVVKQGTLHERAANALVRLCTAELSDPKKPAEQRKVFEEALAAAAEAIMSLDDPPPLAAMMLIRREAEPTDAEVGSPAERDKIMAACKKLDKILERHPDHRDALQVRLVRASLALALKDFEKAEEICKAALKTDARQADARLLLATAAMAQGDYAQAERDLFALKTDFPRWAAAHYAYARAALANKKKELAKEALRTVTELDPDHAEARADLARSLAADGFYDQAFSETKALYDAHPDSPAAVGLFVETAVRTKQPRVALKALEAAEKQFPDRADMQLAVFGGYVLLGNAKAARGAADKASQIKPTTLTDRLAVAQAMLRLGKTAEAETLLIDTAKAYPQSPDAHWQLGGLYLQTRRSMQAVEQYQAAVQLAPQNTAYRLVLAAALHRIGLLDESYAEVRHILERDPSHPGASLLATQIGIQRGESPAPDLFQEQAADRQRGLPLARIYLSGGQPEQCVDVCRTILKENPDDPDTLWILGRAYLVLGRADQCIEQLAAAVKVAPDRLPLYQALATVLSRDKDPAEVESSLAAIPGAKRELVDSAIGWVFERSRRYEAAAEAYGRLSGRADAPEGWRNLAMLNRARCLALAGHTGRAMLELNQLPKKAPWHTRMLTARAAILAQAGRADEAGPLLQELQTAAIQAADTGALARIGLFHLRTRQPEKALAVSDELQRLRPRDPQSCLLRAAALGAMGRKADAIESFRKAVVRQPGNFANRIRLARALDAEQRPKEALEALAELEKHSQTGKAIARYEQGLLFARWGLQKQAIEHLGKLADEGGVTRPELRLALGQSLARLGERAKARQELRKVPKYAAQYVSAQQLLAGLAESDDEKLAILRKAESDKPGLANLAAQRMDILLRADRPGEAVKEFQAFVADMPQDAAPPGTLCLLAVHAMLRTGDHQGAAKLSVETAKRIPRPAWKRTAALLTMDNQPETARTMLPETGKADLHDAILGLCLAARTNDDTKKWTDRLAQLEDLLAQATPPATIPMTYKVLAAVATGANAEAEKQLEASTRQDLIGRAVMGELISSAKSNPGIRAEAVKLLKSSVAMDLGLPECGRAWALESLKARPASQWAAALAAQRATEPADLRNVLKVLKPPDCVLARMIQASLLTHENQFEKAAQIYRLAAEAENGNPQLVMNQAMATDGGGRRQEALPLYDQVWEKTQNPAAANNAAYLTSELHASDKDELAKAVVWSEAAVKAAPTMAAFRDTKGWIAHLMGRNDEAIPELRRAVKGLPDAPEIHYHLGLAENQAGNTRLARWHLQAAVDLGEGLKARGEDIPKGAAKAIRLAREALAKLEGA